MVQPSHQHIYEFGPFRIDDTKRLLLRDGQVAPLTPKCFDLLLALVEHSGKVIEKDDLMKRVWPDSFVEEGNLTYNISILRKALGERADEHQYIVTVPGRGYRFVASVSGPLDEGDNSPAQNGSVTMADFGERTSTDPQAGGAASKTGPSKIRRSSVAAIAVLSVVAVCVAALTLKSFLKEQENVERIPIAVVDFVNETDDEELNGLSGLLITSLEQSRRLSVLTRSRLFEILKQMGKESADRIDESLGREICNRANVSALVVASVRKFDQLYTIDLKVLDPQTNQYIFTAKEEGEGKARIPSMIDKLSERTRAGLRERTAEIQAANREVADVTTTNLEAYRHYFLGEELYGKDKTHEAAEEFEKAIQLDPTFALAHYRLAYMIAWSNPGLAEEPVQRAMRHIDRAPEKERYMIRAVQAYVEGNPNEAIAISQEALKLYPTYWEALWMVGDNSFHLGDYQTAITYIEKVLELDPHFEPARGHLLWVFRDSGDYNRMEQYAMRYVEEAPTEEVYQYLVEAHVLQHDFDSAAQANRRFLEAFPRGWIPIWVAGQTYLLENDYKEAEREGGKLIEGSRPPEDKGEGYGLLSESYVYRGKYREAVNAIDRAIETALNEGNRRALAFYYAKKAYWLLIGHNDTDEALGTIDQMTKLNAGGALAYQSLFYCYLTMGEYEKASPIVMRHLGALGPFGDAVVSGYAHRASGEYEAAIREFQTVSERGFPVDKMMTGYELARCYFETGQHEKAIEAVWKMQRLYAFGMRANQYRATVYPRGFYLLGRIYENKQDQKAAVENYEKFLDLWKDADRDLPELIDAKSRLARIKAVSSGPRSGRKNSSGR